MEDEKFGALQFRRGIEQHADRRKQIQKTAGIEGAEQIEEVANILDMISGLDRTGGLPTPEDLKDNEQLRRRLQDVHDKLSEGTKISKVLKKLDPEGFERKLTVLEHLLTKFSPPLV